MNLYRELSIGILAGGKSQRMGTNKAYLSCGAQTFLQRLTEEFQVFEEVMISVDEVRKYQEFSSCLVEDVRKGIGPMEGMIQLMRQAKNNYVFVCGTDMPLLKKELALYLAQFLSSDYDCYVLTESGIRHPLCAIYSKSALGTAEELLQKGSYRLHSLLNALKTKYVPIEWSCYSAEMLCNINTRKDYARNIIPEVFCVSGVKNSGKTTLIEKLIPKFLEAGRRVKVLKHDGHDFDMDVEKTDTYRFAQAGCQVTGIFSKYKNAVIEYKMDTTLEEMIGRMKGEGVLIIEGMKDSTYPKIEVVRQDISKETVCDPRYLIGVATDAPLLNMEQMLLPINDADAIYRCVTDYFNRRQFGQNLEVLQAVIKK